MGDNWSGSPVGTFNQNVRVGFAGAVANQQIIAAPGAGFAIYVQSVVYEITSAANSFIGIHAAGGALFSVFDSNVFPVSQQQIFPGGFRLPDATALQADAGAGANIVNVTYTIGPTI